MSNLSLAFNLNFTDLYQRDGIAKIDQLFVEELKSANLDLYNRFISARSENLDKKEESNLLIEVAPYVEDFIAKTFAIEKEVKELAGKHDELANIYSCKRLFVQRQAIKKYKESEAISFDGNELKQKLEEAIGKAFTEKTFSDFVNNCLEEKDKHEEILDIAAKYAAWAIFSEEGKKAHKIGVLFKVPKKLLAEHLVEVESHIVDGVTQIKLPEAELRYREGFSLTDNGGSLTTALDDANYCIYCHNQGKDSCSTGLKDKKTNDFKINEHNIKQAGCPLEEKISEMNTLKARGVAIGALAVVAIDNPLCAATGHRICNDCMKSCIYQKQEPVNIPRTETRTLQDVLDLPWGFEIYGLLTRWNPLNLKRPIPKEESGYKVLVAGLGPAGFNLSHHLLNEGHTVVAIDGLKIEPLPSNISGVAADGSRAEFEPIRNIQELFDDLDSRVQYGFGGVAEYGITIRWNKNYLKVIRLLLERRAGFAMYGGVRFGSTITYDQAWQLGFDHIALCMGAGKPNVLSIPNIMSRGVRTASDFLMALQLSGAARKDSIANMQVRLPVVVIGGGLTAIDTATESLAYYPVQVEKFLKRYEKLVAQFGEEQVRNRWDEEEQTIADEFIAHARAIRLEKATAKKENRMPNVVKLINQWGGVKLAYRKKLTDSPAYRLNHEEVEKAFEEGIEFIENATPASVELDRFKHASGLHVKIKNEDGEIDKVLAAKSIYIAAGTNPNTTLSREDKEHFVVDGKYFKAIDEDGNVVSPESNTSKPENIYVLTHKTDKNKFISFFGDMHPSYVGNVVKAMGAAKQGYPIISSSLSKEKPASGLNNDDFIKSMNNEIIATVHDVIRLTPTIIEVIVKAPLAARNFHPGQFYRLQNFESNAITSGDDSFNTMLAMEGLALTGAWVDKEKGLLSTIVLEMGGSSDLCAYLKKDEPIILMGPTGTPTEIPSGETVMLVGGGLGNAVLFSIGKALKENGSKVLYFAGYKKSQDRYKVKEIEEASDKIIWACDESAFTPERAGDYSFHGNIVEAIKSYGQGLLGKEDILLSDVDRIICIGSDRMMAAVGKARHTVLKDMLKPKHEAIGSINSPMQCMMKEICAQCLQRHVDPVTGEEKYVYSCFNQDQNIDCVDFAHLNERLRQNTTQEKLTAKWIDYCLKTLELRNNKAA